MHFDTEKAYVRGIAGGRGAFRGRPLKRTAVLKLALTSLAQTILTFIRRSLVTLIPTVNIFSQEKINRRDLNSGHAHHSYHKDMSIIQIVKFSKPEPHFRL